MHGVGDAAELADLAVILTDEQGVLVGDLVLHRPEMSHLLLQVELLSNQREIGRRNLRYRLERHIGDLHFQGPLRVCAFFMFEAVSLEHLANNYN